MTDGTDSRSTMHNAVSCGGRIMNIETPLYTELTPKEKLIASDVRSRMNLSNIQGGSKWTTLEEIWYGQLPKMPDVYPGG